MRTRLTILLLAVAILATAFAPAASADAPAPVTDLRASRSDTNVILTWTHTDATIVRYEVWRSDQFYARVGDAGNVSYLATGNWGGLTVGSTASASHQVTSGA
jgi:hypothetical protein